MLQLIEIVRRLYETYTGDESSHRLRLSAFALLSVVIASLSVDPAEKALEAIAVTVSVLAGFSFTALFSSWSLSVSDLPEAKTESDRNDLIRLEKLISSFNARSKFFIIASVICLFLVVIMSIQLNLSKIHDIYSTLLEMTDFPDNKVDYLVFDVAASFVCFMSFFLFFEILHTFYRMSETVFAILDTRKRYLKRRP